MDPQAASLHLVFSRNDSGNVLHVREQQPPWKVVRAFDSLVHLHNVSGGVLAGDRLDLRVEVEEGAAATLTTTGATRIYRGARTSRQTARIQIGRNALLEYLPDPLIPFAGSNFEQRTSISMRPGAGLFWWETVAPGRDAAGEKFLYDRLTIRVKIHAGALPVAIENMTLEPALRDPHSPARLGPFSYFTSFYICRVGEDAARWRALEAELAAPVAALSGDEVRWGVSALAAHGLLVRGVSAKARHIPPGLFEFWRAAKRFLHGQDAVLPRKMY